MPLSEHHLTEWKVHAFTARTCKLALERVFDPRPNSVLAIADLHYPWEKVSAWSRDYLRGAAEHLGFWADSVAPYEFPPNAVNNVTAGYRPYLLLGRAALEAAAHALWLLAAPTVQDAVRRHVRLMYRDFRYHRAALKAGGKAHAQVDERIENLKTHATKLDSSPKPTEKVPSYEHFVKLAAVQLEQDVDEWAYLWNAASGAAHGQNWFTIEGFELTQKHEYEPGYFRITRFPDPEFITATIGAAVFALEAGTHLWIKLAGHPLDTYLGAAQTIFERTPKVTDTDDQSACSNRVNGEPGDD
jgi:hypothetical protein